MFGEDYLRLKHFLVDGNFLMIRGKVQKRKWSKDENDLEFKINTLELLADAREKMTKSFHLQIPVNEVNNELVEEVFALINDHPGKCELKIKLVDTVDNITVEMPSRKSGVEVSNELLERIKEIDHVEYYLNDRMTK